MGSGASHYQQNSKETSGKNVIRQAEAGPPHRDTWILNEPVMKKVENSVSDECSHNHPKVFSEAKHGEHEKATAAADSDPSAGIAPP
jgi:hypothetical protein